jgi:hypothetical protein
MSLIAIALHGGAGTIVRNEKKLNISQLYKKP